VPAPTVRVANAATRLWLHEDARAGRDLAVAAFSGLALAGELESTIRARTDLVLTASADAEVA
jgi:hypothetical protein